MCIRDSVKGVKKAFEELLGFELVVPHHSQFAGAVGIATLASGVSTIPLLGIPSIARRWRDTCRAGVIGLR